MFTKNLLIVFSLIALGACINNLDLITLKKSCELKLTRLNSGLNDKSITILDSNIKDQPTEERVYVFKTADELKSSTAEYYYSKIKQTSKYLKRYEDGSADYINSDLIDFSSCKGYYQFITGIHDNLVDPSKDVLSLGIVYFNFSYPCGGKISEEDVRIALNKKALRIIVDNILTK